jgi:membrane associated rhomboid family serine protease
VGAGHVRAGSGWRILTYPFVHLSMTHALFVIVFTLALGNLIAISSGPGR